MARFLPQLTHPLLCALLLTACGDEREPTARTSIDVVVVENAAVSSDSRLEWTIGEGPVLSIGLEKGDDAYHLFDVRDATVLPNGHLAVGNRGTGEIRLFQPDGTHVGSMGAVGEGPGEFRGLEAIEPWVGDSILGWDVRQQRISVFDGDGNHGRTFRVSRFNDSFGPQLMGVPADGLLFFRAGFPQRDDEPYRDMFRPDQVYALLNGEGELVIDLGAHPGEEGFLSAGGGFETFSQHPHGKTTEAAVWGDYLLISPNDAYELRAFGLDGQLAKVVRLEREAPRPTRADMREWFEEFTANDTPEERASFRRTFEDLPLLESFPAFSALVVDKLDYIWVRDFTEPGDDRAIWVVFDPEGQTIGRIETPSGLEVYEIGADYLLGRARDEMGVESIQRWSLAR